MPETKPHLFVGVPSFGGKMSVELHRWLTALEVCGAMGQAPFTVSMGIVTGVSPVQYARNVLLRIALETPAARIVLIDDDMLPDSTTMSVIMSDADICVPRMYRFRHNGPDAFSAAEGRPPEIAACATYVKDLGNGTSERSDIVPRYDATGAVAVDACGTGFMMIKRCVLDDPRMRVGLDDADGTPAIFRMVQSETGKITDWEDVDFSLRASRLGYTVVADFGAHCGHRKAINLDAVAELMHLQHNDHAQAVA
jgi:hypothetical protein